MKRTVLVALAWAVIATACRTPLLEEATRPAPPAPPPSTPSIAPAASATAKQEGLLKAPGRGELTRTLPEGLAALVEHADEVLVASLDPEGESDADPLGAYHIVQKAALPAAERTALLHLLEEGVAKSDGSMAKCFNPRHAVLARVGARTLRIDICFECRQIYINDGGAEPYRLPTADNVQARVDALFRKVGVTKKASRARD